MTNPILRTSRRSLNLEIMHIKVDKLEDHRVEWAMVSKTETDEQAAAVSKSDVHGSNN